MKLQYRILESRYETLKRENKQLLDANIKLCETNKMLKRENKELLLLLDKKVGVKNDNRRRII